MRDLSHCPRYTSLGADSSGEVGRVCCECGCTFDCHILLHQHFASYVADGGEGKHMLFSGNVSVDGRISKDLAACLATTRLL